MGPSYLLSCPASLQNKSKRLLKWSPEDEGSVVTEQTKGSSDESQSQAFNFTSCLKISPWSSTLWCRSLADLWCGYMALGKHLAGKPGQCGKPCALQGQGRRAKGFVVRPSFSESSPQQHLSDTVSGAASFLTLRVFLGSLRPEEQ